MENKETKKNQKELPEEVKELFDLLCSKDGNARKKARTAIVSMGTKAVDYISEIIDHPKRICRWEAFKALGEIAEPDSASLLVKGLEDEESDVRWLAAEGLINLGKEGVIAALEALIEKTESIFLTKGVHHVLKEYLNKNKDEHVSMVLSALDSVDHLVNAPIAADKALKELKKDL